MNYIGIKLVDAIPMTLADFKAYMGQECAEAKNTEEGFLIEDLDGGPPNHPAHKGCISWLPASVFDRYYRPVDCISFGMDLGMTKAGKTYTS